MVRSLVKLVCNVLLDLLNDLVGEFALQPRGLAATAVEHLELALGVAVVVQIAGGCPAVAVALVGLEVSHADDARNAGNAGFDFGDVGLHVSFAVSTLEISAWV